MKEETTEYGPQYYSQRGEDTPPRYDDDIFDFLKKENNEEYAYIWTVNNKWVCQNMNQFNDNDPEKVEIPSGHLAVWLSWLNKNAPCFKNLPTNSGFKLKKKQQNLK